MNEKKRWVSGDHLVICDVCGFEFYRSQTRLRWDNLLVCRADFELRHPQDFLRVKPEKIGVDIARPEQTDVFGAATVDDL